MRGSDLVYMGEFPWPEIWYTGWHVQDYNKIMGSPSVILKPGAISYCTNYDQVVYLGHHAD